MDFYGNYLLKGRTFGDLVGMGTLSLDFMDLSITWTCFCWRLFSDSTMQFTLFTTIWENIFLNVSNHQTSKPKILGGFAIHHLAVWNGWFSSTHPPVFWGNYTGGGDIPRKPLDSGPLPHGIELCSRGYSTLQKIFPLSTFPSFPRKPGSFKAAAGSSHPSIFELVVGVSERFWNKRQTFLKVLCGIWDMFIWFSPL